MMLRCLGSVCILAMGWVLISQPVGLRFWTEEVSQQRSWGQAKRGSTPDESKELARWEGQEWLQRREVLELSLEEAVSSKRQEDVGPWVEHGTDRSFWMWKNDGGMAWSFAALGPSRTLVYRFELWGEGHESSHFTPSKSGAEMENFQPPWSSLVFSNESLSSAHRRLALFQSQGGSRELWKFYQHKMPSMGWTAFEVEALDDMAVYQRGRATCWIQVQPNGDSSMVTIVTTYL